MKFNEKGLPYCCDDMNKEGWFIQYGDDRITLQEDYSVHYMSDVLKCPWCGVDLWSLYEIGLPAKTQNRVFLQLFNACKNREHFSVGFYLVNSSKRNGVQSYINFCLDYYKSIHEELNIKVVKDPYCGGIEFLSNGSVIQFPIANDNARGRRFNFAVIDKDIDKKIRNCIIYPVLRPYIKNDGVYVEDENNTIEFSI